MDFTKIQDSLNLISDHQQSFGVNDKIYQQTSKQESVVSSENWGSDTMQDYMLGPENKTIDKFSTAINDSI